MINIIGAWLSGAVLLFFSYNTCTYICHCPKVEEEREKHQVCWWQQLHYENQWIQLCPKFQSLFCFDRQRYWIHHTASKERSSIVCIYVTGRGEFDTTVLGMVSTNGTYACQLPSAIPRELGSALRIVLWSQYLTFVLLLSRNRYQGHQMITSVRSCHSLS